MRRLFYFPMLLLALNGFAQFCTDNDRFTEVDYFAQGQLGFDLDVTYATNILDYQGNPTDLKIDLVYPSLAIDTLSKRPFVMLIHGGGFTSGNKEGMRNLVVHMAQKGFVVASLQYRLGWDQSNPLNQVYAIYRAQQDAHASMRYISENADTYRIDTNWLFIGGQSAGAITSMSSIYTDEAEWEMVIPGIVDSLGSLDNSGNALTNTYEVQGCFNNWGSTFGLGIQASELVPTISFHGFLDTTVPIGISDGGMFGSIPLDSVLQENGVCSELMVDSLGNHGIFRLPDGQVHRVGRASCFFKSIFCDQCVTEYYTDSIPADCSSTVTSLFNNDSETDVLSLFPNPTEDNIRITVNNKGTLSLLNLKGETLYLSPITSGDHEFSLSPFPSGIYYIRLETNDGIIAKKVLKK